MKKSKAKSTPKREKPAIVARGKLGGSGPRADSCASCAGSKLC